MTVLLVDPGASWSTADVGDGIRAGLQAHGVDLVRYRLDQRITRSQSWLYYNWRKTVKQQPALTRPTVADVYYQAGIGVLEMALRHRVDVVLIVSGMFLHPDVMVLLRRAQVRTAVLFTETPYDLADEMRVAKLVDGCWTAERTAVASFAAVTRAGYLPHAWHPDRHHPGIVAGDAAVAAHDVVFVGTGFPERIALLSAIDWRGIDLGLYGSWDVSRRHPLRPYVRGGITNNAVTAALYRRAKIGLNLYRATTAAADSLNPRAYELARCGVFHLSSPRREVSERFGALVPTYDTAADADALIRAWLHPDRARDRQDIAAQLPARVAQDSWTQRCVRLIADLQSLQRAA